LGNTRTSRRSRDARRPGADWTSRVKNRSGWLPRPIGDAGLPGATGRRDCSTGETGAQGMTGEPGPIGHTGPQGPRSSGDSGEPGNGRHRRYQWGQCYYSCPVARGRGDRLRESIQLRIEARFYRKSTLQSTWSRVMRPISINVQSRCRDGGEGVSLPYAGRDVGPRPRFRRRIPLNRMQTRGRIAQELSGLAARNDALVDQKTGADDTDEVNACQATPSPV